MPLPAPPLPEDLRERFRDYPVHLAELERTLASVVSDRSIVPDPFERAVWALTDTLEGFSIDARAALREAHQSADGDAVSRAEKVLAHMLHSGTVTRYDLNALEQYFRAFKKVSQSDSD